MMKKIVAFLLLWISVSVMARTVSGVVVDENSAPLGFVSVALLCDSTVVDATVSDAESGSFSFSNASANRLRLSMVGYEDFLMAIPADGQCGTVAMVPSTTLLGEVVVRDRLPQTRLSGNGLVTKIEGSVLETVGTANDVLARLPLVTLENDQVSVLGHGSPIIYINGRQVRSDNELQQLSSENIRSIEVITNPGARYDASVRSVIRIRTKRAPGEGFGFEFYHNTHAKHYVRSTDALNMHFTEGPLQLFAEGYVAYGKSYWGANMDQTTFADHIYTQRLTERTPSRTNYYTGKFGFDYLIGNHSFGAYYKYENGHTHGNGQYNSSIRRDGVHIEDVSSTVANRNVTAPVHSVNAYYNGTVGQLQNRLQLRPLPQFEYRRLQPRKRQLHLRHFQLLHQQCHRQAPRGREVSAHLPAVARPSGSRSGVYPLPIGLRRHQPRHRRALGLHHHLRERHHRLRIALAAVRPG